MSGRFVAPGRICSVNGAFGLGQKKPDRFMRSICSGVVARALVPLALAFAITAKGGGQPANSSSSVRSVALSELWEDTALTRGLPQFFRIYRRFPLNNGLTEQLRLYLVNPREWKPSGCAE